MRVSGTSPLGLAPPRDHQQAGHTASISHESRLDLGLLADPSPDDKAMAILSTLLPDGATVQLSLPPLGTFLLVPVLVSQHCVPVSLSP